MKSWNLAEISVKSWNQFRNLKISKSRTGLYSVADPSERSRRREECREKGKGGGGVGGGNGQLLYILLIQGAS